jgi:hypothetical protein
LDEIRSQLLSFHREENQSDVKKGVINQSINQSFNQSFNQSINASMERGRLKNLQILVVSWNVRVGISGISLVDVIGDSGIIKARNETNQSNRQNWPSSISVLANKEKNWTG